MTEAADALASGGGVLSVEHIGGASALTRLASRSPLKLLPASTRGECVRVNSATFGGGLLARDRIALQVEVHRGSALHVGTAAPTKVYRGDRTAAIQLDARIHDGALLVHTPGPLCCFADARCSQRQRFEVAADGSFVSIDVLTSGRSARGERWAFHSYDSRTEVVLAGKRILHDSLSLTHLPSPIGARMGRFDAIATVLLLGPRVHPLSAQLHSAIVALPVQKAATCLAAASPWQDGLVVRLAADSVEGVELFLRRHLGEGLRTLIGQDPWRARW